MGALYWAIGWALIFTALALALTAIVQRRAR